MSEYGGSTGGDLEQLLNSRALLGVQLDASHLHRVLQGLLQQTTAATQQTNRRLQLIENAVEDLDRRVGRMEGALGDVSGAEDVRNIRDELSALGRAFDELHRQHLPELRRSADDNRQKAANSERAVQQVQQQMRPLEQQVQQAAQAVDGLARQANKNGDEAARLGAALQDVNGRLGKFDRELGDAHSAVEQLARQLQAGGDDGRWREALEEMNGRMNENFRLIEQGSAAVDVEMGKIRSDVANLRAELNTVDNNTRHRIGKVTDDVDEKFKMLLETLRVFESNSTQLEEALSQAGRALAQQRQHRLSAVASQYSGSASPSATMAQPTFRDQTTTQTSLGKDGYLSTDQPPSSSRRSRY